MIRLLVGIPTRGNDISSGLFRFIIDTIAQKNDIAMKVMIGQSSVAAAFAVDKLWEMMATQIDEFDYYMQIDSDVVPPVGTIESMVNKDKDIVVAPVWHYDSISKDIHLNIHPRHLRERQYKIRLSGCEKIYSSSLGLIIMKQKVARQFIETRESPIHWTPMLGDYTGIDIHNDNVFFAKAAKLGFETWVDWDVFNVIHQRGIELSTEVLSKFLDIQRKLNGTGATEEVK